MWSVNISYYTIINNILLYLNSMFNQLWGFVIVEKTCLSMFLQIYSEKQEISWYLSPAMSTTYLCLYIISWVFAST